MNDELSPEDELRLNVLFNTELLAVRIDESNMTLSRNRAGSVANYLGSLDVSATRFTTMGYVETQPVADNESDSGRQANRRVELAIMANDKLKKVAEQKAGN